MEHLTPVLEQEAPVRKKITLSQEWKGYEKFAFRVSFIFFFLLVVPLDIDYYKGWFTTDWSHLHIRDIGKLSGSSFSPVKIREPHPGANDRGSLQDTDDEWLTISPEDGSFGLASYVNWGLALVLGIIGALLWTPLDKKRMNYNTLYYFTLVAVSYAMLMRLEGLTFSKVFPTQMPALALTQLNTPFGDFTPQKLYWLQLSFVHPYETFIGFAELLIMGLLFFRQTRALGAALALSMVGNIAIANHVYDGGIHLAASFYALGGAFVLLPYFPSIWNLIANRKDVVPQIYYYPFSKPWEKYLRLGVKIFIFGFFFVASAYLHYDNYLHDSYKVPSNPGLANARGFYDVSEFKINHKSIPYSPVDSLRWKDVTFEKWSTLSFSVFRKFMIHGEAGRGKQVKDVDRTYESAGTGGGRRHYYYEIDSTKHILHLQNKNKVYKEEKLDLVYERPTSDRIILKGQNEFKDSIYVVLDRIKKDYTLYEGTALK